MTPDDRTFILNLVNLIILAVVGFLTQQNQKKAEALDKKSDALADKMDENHKQTNSRMDQALKTAEEKYLLIGEERGRLKEKEEELVRQAALATSATTAALLQMAQAAPVPAPTPSEAASTPTAANPLLTEDKAAELMDGIAVDKGKGWSPKT